ncbi:hypothetical protein C8R43DRAFT_91022 [Mycena crocata]|nr:hypothetical protein C8R43DRAFT_91022 [Mycena crocata]
MDPCICKKTEEDFLRGSDHIHGTNCCERFGNSSISYGTNDVRERDLPPLPDEAECTTEKFPLNNCPPPSHDDSSSNPFANPLKNSPSALTPSLVKPSKHRLMIPAQKSNSSLTRPKLRLDTGWDSAAVPIHLQSADDGSNASCRSFSGKDSPFASSEENLMSFAPKDHQASSIQSKPQTIQPPSANCRFLGGVRLPRLPAFVLTAAHNKATTTRAINHSHNNIVSKPKPFIGSDPENPLRGIIVTVHQQRLVSEPLAFASPNLKSLHPAASALSISMEKPLPTPVQDLSARDLPAIPAPCDDQPKSSDTVSVPLSGGVINASGANSPTHAYMGRQPPGAKRRKHYRIHRVPVPTA